MEVLIRILLYLLTLVVVYLGFRLPFYLLERYRNEDLMRQFRPGYRATDTGRLNAYFEAAEEDAVHCSHCGAANGQGYNYCHNCLATLGG